MNAYFDIQKHICQCDIDWALKSKTETLEQALARTAICKAAEWDEIDIPNEAFYSVASEHSGDILDCRTIGVWAEEIVMYGLEIPDEVKEYIRVDVGMFVRDRLISGDLELLAHGDDTCTDFVFVDTGTLENIINSAREISEKRAA